MRTKIAICLVVLGALLTPASQAHAAAPGPAWKLLMSPIPTNFAPGAQEEYFIAAVNVGGGETSGPIALEATLPADLEPTQVSGTSGDPEVALPSCLISGQTVECEASDPVHSSRWLGARIFVDVDPGAEGTLSAEASVSGGGAAEVKTTAPTTIATKPPPFDFIPGEAGLSALFTNPDGSAATQAGSHPGQITISVGFPTGEAQGGLGAADHLRSVRTDLPRGLVVNPAASPFLCTEAEFESEDQPGCPPESQVGIVYTMTSVGSVIYATDALYNMVPPPGVPAALGFDAVGAGLHVHLMGGVRSDGDFGLSATINDVLAFPRNPVLGAVAQLWGDPTGPSHDQIRSEKCKKAGGSCPVPEPAEIAFLTMPSQCSGPITTSATIDSWEEPGVFKERGVKSADPQGTPVGVDGCNQLKFTPTITSKPTTNLAESPTGLDFHLHQPQDMSLEGLSTAAVKDIEIALPEGMTLNPAAADGIEGCSSEEIGLITEIGESPIRIDKEPNSCPKAARIGTLEVTTPALAEFDDENKIELDPETGKPILDPLPGSVYLAEPFDNPFDSLLAVYLVLEDEKTGIIAKVAARISADPNTGQLVTHVSENPQLPLEDVRTHFFGGARAPLITPPVCGTHTTTSTMRPWSSPQGADAHPSDSFATTASPAGGQCATSLGAAPNNPAFNAGTIDPVAGAYSPFVMKLERQDASQRLNGVEATLPPGLIGKLAGVALCPEAQIAQAKARETPNQGTAELASPSCPASSEVGEVDVSAGAGPTPLHVKARVYMAGPYKGAPLSLVIITPAVAGPFDLGAVVVRVALDLDPRTAQIHAVADPIPTILQGIPLDLRGAALKAGRPQFILNPTNCDPMAIEGIASTLPGQKASLRSPFQVGGCSGLGFKPKLNLRLKGGTKRGGHPAFQAIYTPRPGDANVKGLVVRLPRSAFLDQAHIRTICTRVQFAANACPPGAQYGNITAWTPLLAEPLQGPVYLRSSDNKLPDLVFDLHGIVDIEVATRIDSVKGGIRASIESAPDAPLTKVVLNMQGQKKGLIVNSRDICKGKNRADVKLDAQNGKVHDFKPRLRAKCGGKGRRGKHKRHKAG